MVFDDLPNKPAAKYITKKYSAAFNTRSMRMPPPAAAAESPETSADINPLNPAADYPSVFPGQGVSGAPLFGCMRPSADPVTAHNIAQVIALLQENRELFVILAGDTNNRESLRTLDIMVRVADNNLAIMQEIYASYTGTVYLLRQLPELSPSSFRMGLKRAFLNEAAIIDGVFNLTRNPEMRPYADRLSIVMAGEIGQLNRIAEINQ